jgi:hypothetical protein
MRGKAWFVWKLALFLGRLCVFFSIVFGYPAFLGLCAWLAVGARRGVYFGIGRYFLVVLSFFFFGRRGGH